MSSYSRRSFIMKSSALALSTQVPSLLRGATDADEARKSVELVHAELWGRFVDKHGVLLDFTDLDGSVSLPTPEECRMGKPNANGWWTPIENGGMFNGLYLDGAVNRALATRSNADRANARRLVEGLLKLASCSPVKGFVGRGFANDGETTWPLGSSDQTSPWFYGLWRYLDGGLADAGLRRRILAKLSEVAVTLLDGNWGIPSQPPYGFRGSIDTFYWESAPRLLFICKAMHQLTGVPAWDRRYKNAIREKPGNGGLDRLELCERGMVFEKFGVPKKGRATWTGSAVAVCLRALWEMEEDQALRDIYLEGLRATAAEAAAGMGYRKSFSNDDSAYYENDWRMLNRLWEPQASVEEARALAIRQLKTINELSPRRRDELHYGREAMFASWVVTLCPDPEVVKRHRAGILATLAHFRADKLHFVSFFPLENTWWRLVSVP